MEWIKGHGHAAYEADGADDEEDDDVGDVWESDVAVKKPKGTGSILMLYISVGKEDIKSGG